MTKAAMAIAIVLLLSMPNPASRSSARESPAEAIYEGLGPTLNSTALAESSNLTFQGSGEVLLAEHDELSISIESDRWDKSSASFGEPTWSDLSWVTRDYFSPRQDGFTLFSSSAFSIRYSQQANYRYVSLNTSYATLRQNFTVPASLNGSEIRYAWVVVQVASGTTRLHCELEDYGTLQTIQTASINVTGPYDWWVVLKLNSSKTLTTGVRLNLKVIWDAGVGASILLLDNVTEPQDCASGSSSLFDPLSLTWLSLNGWMMMSCVTGSPHVNELLMVVPQWATQVQLGNYKLRLHGMNLPQGVLVVTVDSGAFGYGFTPAVFLLSPLSEAEFEVSVLGSGAFSGGTVKVASNLGSVEQSRAEYSANELPPFFRPFSKLAVYTDLQGRPWGEWLMSSSGWRIQVKDERWVWHNLPAPGIIEVPYNNLVTYRLWVFSPVPPNIGFFAYALSFTWYYQLTRDGPIFLSQFKVFPNNVTWSARSNRINVTAPPFSSLKLVIADLPEDWAVYDFYVSSGPGGGTPFARMTGTSLEVGGIDMGQASTYLGNISVILQSSNYLQSAYSSALIMRGGTSASYFLLNDTAMLQAKAASALGVIPPGDVTFEVNGPGGAEVFSAVVSQLEGGSASAGPLRLTQVGAHTFLVKFRSSDGLRVGAKLSRVVVVEFQVNVDKRTVRLSSPNIGFELIPSDLRSIGLAWVNMTGSSGISRRVGLSVGNASASGSFDFSLNDPSEVTDWSAQFWVRFLDGSDRSVGGVEFSVIDDIQPDVSNITILPMQPTLLDDVSVEFSASDRGSGLNSTWVGYIVWSGQEETVVEAQLGADGRFRAVIPRQLPFAQVTLWVKARDRSGNVSVSGPLTYGVGVPLWLWALLLVLSCAGVALYLRRVGRI